MDQLGQAVRLLIYGAKNENLEGPCLAFSQVHESYLSHVGKAGSLQ